MPIADKFDVNKYRYHSMEIALIKKNRIANITIKAGQVNQ